MSSSPAIESPSQGFATGHPKGLYVLFFSEMWERFSYYGMRALLILYLTKHLKMTDDDAGMIYGTYVGLVYVTPIFGGYLADRILGQRKAILVGGIVMALGHFAMAFEPLLYLALGLLIVGNGFFKPNISTMVGNLYPKEDPRRDGAYTIFYMGINLGAMLSPIVCGALQKYLGSHYGFAAAGVGMVFGLLTFVLFQRTLVGGFPPDRQGSTPQRLTVVDYLQAVAVAALCFGFVYACIQSWTWIRPIWRPSFLNDQGTLAYHAVTSILAFAFILWASSKAVSKSTQEAGEAIESRSFTSVEWQRIIVIGVATFFAMIFWAGFEQAGNTLTLFADRKTDRNFLGFEIPAPFFQSINGGLIVLLAPLFTVLWTAIARTKTHISSTAKLGIGLLWVGLGFVIMYYADARAVATGGLVGPQWLFCVYLLHTIGELCLSPIGLSLVNRLAPAKIASLMMAVWFLAPALGGYLGGTLDSILKAFHINLWVFLIFIPIGSGLLMLALNPLLRKMSHGRD
jgi:proton-dependent oligopeptide transporter, POT family